MKNDEFSIPSLETFSTCPQISAVPKESYLQNVIDVAKWSEKHGCRGILVYTDNSQADPWLIAQIIIQNTKRLAPLVAIQPAYVHPYSVAKMIATFGHLYGRRIYLNMVAGGFKNDLAALNDTTPHDKRYQRLVEYTLIIKQLVASPDPVSFSGEFYAVNNLRLTPPLPPELFPGIFISGSSEAGSSDWRDCHQVSEARQRVRPGATGCRTRFRYPRGSHRPSGGRRSVERGS